jgi:hypothetical protein
MNAAQASASDWIDQRANEILAAPAMWGSAEAVEMQILLLLELRWFMTQEEPLRRDARHVFGRYIRFLAGRFPGVKAKPLYQHVAGDYDRLVDELVVFRSLLDGSAGAGAETTLTGDRDGNVVQLDAELRAAALERRKRLADIVKKQPQLARELEHQDAAMGDVLHDLRDVRA